MFKKYALLSLCVLFATLFVVGCSHSGNSAAKIQIGMTKADVLEMMGNPNHTGRRHGSDVWTYTNEQTGTGKIEIYFQGGKVSYIGDGGASPSGSSSQTKSEKGFREVSEPSPTPAPSGQ